MDRQIEVTGAEQAAQPPTAAVRRDSGWRLLGAGAIGVLVGVAAVLLLASRDEPSQATIATEDTALEAPAVVVATRGTVQPPPSLAERVPGLTSDLVAFGFTPSGQAVIQQWFINATEPTTIDVPFGLAIPDQSAQWIAALASQRYGGSSNLHVGNATYQEAIATDVSSVVWSVDQPGRIAWIQRSSDGMAVFDRMMGPGDNRQVFAVPVPPDARIEWLDGDQVTFSTEGSLVALQPDGNETARLEQAALVAATDGWALVWTEGALWLIDSELVPRAPLPHSGTSCGDARFARPVTARPTTGLRLAVVCEGASGQPSLEVLDIDVTTLTFTARTALELVEPRTVNWLDGDRFVAFPQPDPVSRPRSTIMILEVETGEITELAWPGAVLGVIGTR